jgi:hypothetical protein
MTARQITADTLAEIREYIAARPAEARIWLATAWVCMSLLIVTPTLWPWAIFADVVAAAMGLGAWAWLLRRQRDSARATVRELEAEALRLHLLLTEAEMAAPVPFRPADGPVLRVVREDLAALDAEATAYTWPAIARDAFPVREWGEEAEK